MFAKFHEIPSMILQDIKETKRYRHTVGRSDGQRENNIPSHKHSLRGGGGGGGYKYEPPCEFMVLFIVLEHNLYMKMPSNLMGLDITITCPCSHVLGSKTGVYRSIHFFLIFAPKH